MRTKTKSLLITFIFLMLAMNLQYTFWFGKNSVNTLKETKNLIEAEDARNAELQIRNNVLKAEVMDLKNDADSMEERARMELGYIKDGETFYRVVKTQ